MAINIHFFRKNSLEKFDYEKVLEYFETLKNFKIYYTDDSVEIVYSDEEFNFEYRYLIMKKSRVSKIYELSPMYTNINFLLEMPILIPTFLAKEILTIVQKLCKMFDLDIYNETFKDVQPFNVVDVLVLFDKMRSDYVEEFGLQGKTTCENEKLNIICKYQRSVDNLKEYYQNKVDVKYCVPVVDYVGGESGFSYEWKIGTPAVFPPYIDYIYVILEDDKKILIKREDFYHIMGKYFIEIKTFLPDLYVIKDRNAKSSRKEVKKLMKVSFVNDNFRTIRLCDVIEK